MYVSSRSILKLEIYFGHVGGKDAILVGEVEGLLGEAWEDVVRLWDIEAGGAEELGERRRPLGDLV